MLAYRPAVNDAQRSRKLAIKAFLQIPKDTVLKTYMRYKFEPQEARYVDADGESDDDDDNNDAPGSSSLPSNPGDVFKRITIWYSVSLTLLVSSVGFQ